MSSSDDDAASSSPSAGSSEPEPASSASSASTSAAATADESASSASTSAAASADESAEESAKSSAASRKSNAGTEPSVAATRTSEGTSEADASSSSSPECDASSADGDGDEDDRGSKPEPKATEKGPSSAAETEADGSVTGTCSGESSEDGSVSETGTAATAKVDSSKVVETFDGGASQTLAEHVASHNFPMHVRQCGACRFWQHKEAWSAACSATNPATQKKETWLGHAGGGLGVCLFCAAFKGGRCRTDLGRGIATFSRYRRADRFRRCRQDCSIIHWSFLHNAR